jgi:hypothetical protein
VTQEQAGREIYYHFNPEKMKVVEAWLSQFQKMLEDRFGQLDELLINLKNNKNEKQS